MNASKVTIASKASNSTSSVNTSNSTSIADSSNSISASASSTVSSIVSQGETSEEPCTVTVSSVQKIISKPQGPKRKLKQVDLLFYKKENL